MKIIYFSTAPFIGVGYGVTTRELVQRMMKDGQDLCMLVGMGGGK